MEYGRSVLVAPLIHLPPNSGQCGHLVIVGIHGEAPETTVTLSRAVRSIVPGEIAEDIGIVPCTNPDGVALGTKRNANGLDLNRNYC